MLKVRPKIKESQNAVDFKFINGQIVFENIGYTHYIHHSKMDKKKEDKN